MRTKRFDDAVVGAGVIGLAHAYHLARRGRRVIVFERNGRAQGASVRNFGMLWPIGQPAGPLRRLAIRSREVWLDILAASGLWHDRVGSLHLAYRDDEAQVLTEFAEQARDSGFECESLDALASSQQIADGPARGSANGPFQPVGDVRRPTRGNWWPAPACSTDARKVSFAFGTTVVGFESPRLLRRGRLAGGPALGVRGG